MRNGCFIDVKDSTRSVQASTGPGRRSEAIALHLRLSNDLEKSGVTAVDKKYKTIGLLDHMGWGNMGDAAVQEAFIINIKQRLPNAVLIGFSMYPDDTRKRHNIVTYPIRWWYPGWKGSGISSANVPEPQSKLRSILKRCRPFYACAKPVRDVAREFLHLIRSYKIVRSLDLLIMSGGGQLCELHGDLPYNVFKFCVLAKLSNTPLFIVGVGADLLERPLNRFFARWSVRLADYASFRSDESQALIRSLGVTKETHVCPDPAYALGVPEYLAAESSNTLTNAESQDLLRTLGAEMETQVRTYPAHAFGLQGHPTAKPSNKPKLKVGLNPMGFCDPRRWPRKDEAVYRDYLDKVAAFSAWLLTQGYHLEIFTSDALTDVFAIEDLKKKLVAVVSADEASKVVFRPLPTLKELLRQMSTFDYVITSKFHGVIFSHLLGKPMIALSYLPKIDHLMRAGGYDRYCLDIEHFDVKTLIESFQSLVDERDYLRALFRETSTTYADALRVHFDNLFGAEVVTQVRLAETGSAEVAGSRNEIR
jgi:polysaccharide pyruvyl transferase WcaK-like protein